MPPVMPATDNLVAMLGIAAVTIAGRATFGSWLHPGAFFALAWLFLLVFSFSAPLFGAEQYYVWSGALWWIALTLVCVYVGSGQRRRSAIRSRSPRRGVSSGTPYR